MMAVPALGKNVVFNYASQFYTGFIGILVLPLYLQYLGPEGYGLVAFFTVMQSWMQLLDLGVSPTLSREVARLKDQPEDSLRLRSVVRSIEAVFFGVALLASCGLFFSRGWLAGNWLDFQVLDSGTVSACFGLLAPLVGLRLMTSLHRSGINGFEEQVWTSIVNTLFVTLRFPVSLLLIIWTEGNLIAFFIYQLTLSMLEQGVFAGKLYRLLPQVDAPVMFCVAELKRVAPFALGLAYTGAIWVLITQLDKILLAKVLPLAEYGYFMLAATVSGGLVLLSSPVSAAILPRMTALLAQRRDREMLLLYRRSTRFVVCMVVPLTLILAAVPRQSIYIWTGDAIAARWVAEILPPLVLGNGLLAIGAFQYYLQYAHGQLRQHVIYNTGSAMVSVPLVIYAAFQHGALGVAWTWFGLRLVSLVLWTPYVHHLFAPGLHRRWIWRDVGMPAAIGAMVVFGLLSLLAGHFPAERIAGFLVLAVVALLTVVISLSVSFWQQIHIRLRAGV